MSWKDKYVEPLSEKEIYVLEKMEVFALKNKGRLPTVEEITSVTNIKSKGTIASILERLEYKGAIIQLRDPKTGIVDIKILKSSRILGEEEKIFRSTSKFFKTKKQINIAMIPLLGQIKDSENFFAEINIEEYIAVPISFHREENMFAFSAYLGADKNLGMPIGSYIVVDIKAQYLSRDFVAVYDYNEKQLVIKRYYITEELEEHQKIVGKIVGAFQQITY